MKTTQKEYDDQLGEIVDRIMERGKQLAHEEQGHYNVKDGGVTLRRLQFIEELKQFAKTEAVSLAEDLIGQDRKIRVSFTDISDEEPVENPADVAVHAFQNAQKQILEYYKDPQSQPTMHCQEETLEARSGRVS